jgi:hypothetical protein
MLGHRTLREPNMSLEAVAAFLAAALILSVTRAEAACPESVCRTALQTPGVLRCSFVQESLGGSYYTIDVDREFLEALSSPKDERSFVARARLASIPVVIMMNDDDHPLAAVRMMRLTGGYSELTRQEYRECADLHGDPSKLLPAGAAASEQERLALMNCLLERM